MVQSTTVIEAAKYSEIPLGTGLVINLEKENIALFRCSNGSVFAIENKSPHPKGGTLAEGLVSGEYVFCPLYDWKISLQSGEVQAPDEGKLRTFPVKVEEGIVYLTI
ncbi:nitrite reductase small subunit NirD [Litchfieldia salsa]|uniref:Assimilatory nitrite reductase (NAD(P)H) small subunit n=1 Tax=Litchfieldia salsa TaxID=930152 RepID=A0A1H0WKG8_9BACI|nr:nitrite reductase small subunit NirD [Litchfieldia salsa]SDP91214.1 assimilatory nitrite reductase (NAD(P)H) small subunit [Litchfieldia salsa]